MTNTNFSSAPRYISVREFPRGSKCGNCSQPINASIAFIRSGDSSKRFYCGQCAKNWSQHKKKAPTRWSEYARKKASAQPDVKIKLFPRDKKLFVGVMKHACGTDALETVYFHFKTPEEKTISLPISVCKRCGSYIISGPDYNDHKIDLLAYKLYQTATNAPIKRSEKDIRKAKEAKAQQNTKGSTFPEPNLVPVKRPPREKTEITSVRLESEGGDFLLLSIVADSKYQNSFNYTFWKGRHVSLAILNAIQTGNPWVKIKKTTYIIRDYNDTPELYSLLKMSEMLSAETIWLYRNKTPCPKHPGQVESVTAYVESVRNHMPNPLNIQYCKVCKRYYINETSYQMYAKRYGLPILNISPLMTSGHPFDPTQLQEHSPLYIAGYNVSAEFGLSDRERHRILAEIIASGTLTKSQVVSHLETLIKYRGNELSMQNAVSKWELDLSFVHQYDLQTQRTVTGSIRIIR